jgi:hypothetical protein
MYISLGQLSDIEYVRKLVDPTQFQLIPAHVTLCRSGELENWKAIESRLQAIPYRGINLKFGKPNRFNGHGIIMECTDGLHMFSELREYLLGSSDIANQLPHLTLAHPRNSKSKGNSLENTKLISIPFSVRLNQIKLIEQKGASKWKILRAFAMEEPDC